LGCRRSDLNEIAAPGQFEMIVANHALHHIVGLERHDRATA